jgi:hypothetical protein
MRVFSLAERLEFRTLFGEEFAASERLLKRRSSHVKSDSSGRFPEVYLHHISLARSPEEPQFAVALLKLVIELRNDRRVSLQDAMARALKGMRVDREAFYNHVMANRDRYRAAVTGPTRVRLQRR